MKMMHLASVALIAVTISKGFTADHGMTDVPFDIWKSGFGSNRHQLRAELANGDVCERTNSVITYRHQQEVLCGTYIHFYRKYTQNNHVTCLIDLKLYSDMTNQEFTDALNRGGNSIKRLTYKPQEELVRHLKPAGARLSGGKKDYVRKF